MNDLRLVLLGLSEGGKRTVSNKMLFEALGLTTEAEKVRVRSSMGRLLRNGEATRVEDGVYRLSLREADPNTIKALRKIWRAVRAAKPGWTIADIKLVSGACTECARDYVNWLIGEGFVVRHGKAGNTLKYLTTMRGQETRETPIPPREVKDPFAREKNATVAMLQAMLSKDLYRPAVRAKIVENCKAILARFEKEEETHGDA